MKFWQNDFVLGLTAEERYFYIYLVTNSMTNNCGIYKLNRKLAELETGYTSEKIDRCLEKFEEYGKVLVSKTSTEIMLVNWLKHNFKNSKKAIGLINKELMDVKDKELIQKLYDFCIKRQYPTAELFAGVIVPEIQREKCETEVEGTKGIIAILKEEIKSGVKEKEILNCSASYEENRTAKESAALNSAKFTDLLKEDKDLMGDKLRQENLVEEELVIKPCQEDDVIETGGGTTVRFWGFAEGGGSSTSGEGGTSSDVSIRCTA